jgi:uncharacterized protein YbbC (DUF1343 family)
VAVKLNAVAACRGNPPPTILPIMTAAAAFNLDQLTAACRGLRTGLAFTPAAWTPPLGDLGDYVKAHCDLRAFLALEHGLRGELQDGVAVESYTDARTGLPVFSFYGEKKSVPDAFWDAVDVAVFCTQDVSHRAYTFQWTLAELLASAARRGRRVVVLDRPTPLAHLGTQGPMGKQFFPLPFPQFPALTLGELALWLAAETGEGKRPKAEDRSGNAKFRTPNTELNAQNPQTADHRPRTDAPVCAGRDAAAEAGRMPALPCSTALDSCRCLPMSADIRRGPPGAVGPCSLQPSAFSLTTVQAVHRSTLTVIPVRNWRRGQSWRAAGLPWVPPSPNIPNVEAAYAYACTGILQATSISEGRGTCQPFSFFGAPFLDGRKLAETLNAHRLPGVLFRETCFKPGFNKFAGQICHGVHLMPRTPHRLRPLRTQMTILQELARLSPGDFTLTAGFGDWLDNAAGWTPARLAELDIPAFEAACAAECATFRVKTAPFELYGE